MFLPRRVKGDRKYPAAAGAAPAGGTPIAVRGADHDEIIVNGQQRVHARSHRALT
jgi:hypothetical protein